MQPPVNDNPSQPDNTPSVTVLLHPMSQDGLRLFHKDGDYGYFLFSRPSLSAPWRYETTVHELARATVWLHTSQL